MSGHSNNTDIPAYLVARICINDDKGRYMAEYAMPAIPIVEKFGGEVLAASAEGDRVEGGSPADWTVILRFPSRKQLDAFYTCAEYQPYKKLRIESLTRSGDTVLVDGFDPSALLG